MSKLNPLPAPTSCSHCGEKLVDIGIRRQFIGQGQNYSIYMIKEYCCPNPACDFNEKIIDYWQRLPDEI